MDCNERRNSPFERSLSSSPTIAKVRLCDPGGLKARPTDAYAAHIKDQSSSSQPGSNLSVSKTSARVRPGLAVAKGLHAAAANSAERQPE